MRSGVSLPEFRNMGYDHGTRQRRSSHSRPARRAASDADDGRVSRGQGEAQALEGARQACAQGGDRIALVPGRPRPGRAALHHRSPPSRPRADRGGRVARERDAAEGSVVARRHDLLADDGAQSVGASVRRGRIAARLCASAEGVDGARGRSVPQPRGRTAHGGRLCEGRDAVQRIPVGRLPAPARVARPDPQEVFRRRSISRCIARTSRMRATCPAGRASSPSNPDRRTAPTDS